MTDAISAALAKLLHAQSSLLVETWTFLRNIIHARSWTQVAGEAFGCARYLTEHSEGVRKQRLLEGPSTI
jgi:hypothetical protein